MIKYIKHAMAVDGIEVFPIIAFLIFFSVFIIFLFMAIRMDKKTEDHLKNLPLDIPAPSNSEESSEGKS